MYEIYIPQKIMSKFLYTTVEMCARTLKNVAMIGLRKVANWKPKKINCKNILIKNTKIKRQGKPKKLYNKLKLN